MEEIKVGEYIRYNDGTIIRAIEGEQSYYNYILKNKKGLFKHSSNIIDLIEVGDIIIYTINCKIAEIDIVKEHTDARTLEKTLRVGLWSLEQVDIKQILTKEKFESESYRLEE